MRTLGIDTSNYTTSAAVFDGMTGENVSRILDVRQGGLGLRQSEALFQHVKHLPERFAHLKDGGWLTGIAAVGASTQPRAVEGSYMPCFLAGESQGRVLSSAMGVPFFSCSHQQGHIAAAAWSAGRMDLLDKPMLVWHLSGGTTELLHVQPDGANVKAECIGGTTDISAGQLIDRAGVMLGMSFPCGKSLDTLAASGNACKGYAVKLNNLSFSLSGMENKVKEMFALNGQPGDIARFVLETVARTVRRVTEAALVQYPGLPVLCSGGVASNRLLRKRLPNVVFAEPRFSTDNAMGVAILTWRSMKAGEEE